MRCDGCCLFGTGCLAILTICLQRQLSRVSVSVVSFILCSRVYSRTKVPTMSSLSAVSECVKCGTTRKSGKRSCCARGGNWFKNCGDAGDTKFDHTWSEGIRACEGFVTSISVKSSLQVVPVDLTEPQDGYRRQKIVYSPGGMINADNTDSTDCIRLTKVFACMCVFVIIPPV